MEWIKIEDRLPKVGELCLLYQTYPDGTMFNCRADPLPRCFIYVGGLRYNGMFISKEDQYSEKGLKFITHWMPLPNTPN